MFLKRSNLWQMPEKFNILATYNSEVSRGLVHTEEWRTHMAVLQVQFNDWRDEQIAREGATHKAGSNG